MTRDELVAYQLSVGQHTRCTTSGLIRVSSLLSSFSSSFILCYPIRLLSELNLAARRTLSSQAAGALSQSVAVVQCLCILSTIFYFRLCAFAFVGTKT